MSRKKKYKASTSWDWRIEEIKKSVNKVKQREEKVAKAKVENERILKQKVRQKVVVSCVIFIVGMIISLLTAFANNSVPLLLAGFCITAIVTLAFVLSAINLKKNACPNCHAISSWIYLGSHEIGQTRTSVRKKVETVHTAFDRAQPAPGYQRYAPQKQVGRSVTYTTVPAVRYAYREEYKCDCCGKIKNVYSQKTVEQ